MTVKSQVLKLCIEQGYNYSLHCRFNPIPASQGRNRPLYEHHVAKSGRNRVNLQELPLLLEF